MNVDTKMTAIADKLRALLGLTGTMGLDDMAANLGTEQSNITAALSAIAGKGVTVPEGSNSDNLAALIAAIEAGGDSNIVVGSFTLSEALTTDSPLCIDIPFPKNEFPLMYCVFEDTSNLNYNDTSHTTYRLRYLISSRTFNTFLTSYYPIGCYNNSGSYTMNFTGDVINHLSSNGYATSGGVYGSMDVSLTDNQIKFKATADGAPYLAGRTYRYILYWGD